MCCWDTNDVPSSKRLALFKLRLTFNYPVWTICFLQWRTLTIKEDFFITLVLSIDLFFYLVFWGFLQIQVPNHTFRHIQYLNYCLKTKKKLTKNTWLIDLQFFSHFCRVWMFIFVVWNVTHWWLWGNSISPSKNCPQTTFILSKAPPTKLTHAVWNRNQLWKWKTNPGAFCCLTSAVWKKCSKTPRGEAPGSFLWRFWRRKQTYIIAQSSGYLRPALSSWYHICVHYSFWQQSGVFSRLVRLC